MLECSENSLFLFVRFSVFEFLFSLYIFFPFLGCWVGHRDICASDVREGGVKRQCLQSCK